MSVGPIHGGNHIHLWTKSIDGAEFANAIYENYIDAALTFCSITQQLRQYAIDEPKITIEDVVRSLENGRGMYVGSPGLVLVVSRCEGGCISPSWN